MIHKIPNTNLELSDSEINAVVNYVYNRSIGSNKQNKQEDERRKEFFKERVNTGKLRDKNGKLPVPPLEYSYFIEDKTC